MCNSSSPAAPGLAVIPADVHAALEAGDARAANQLGRDWVNRRIGEDFPSARPWSLWMMSHVVGELEPDVAEGLHRWLLPYEAEWVVGTPESCFGSAQIHLGRAARAAGWLDEAVLRYTAAVKEHERVGEVPWQANTLVELASTLRDRARSGDTERAAREAAAAADLAERHGLTAVGRRADAVLAELGAVHRDTLGITDRERQVLELVAGGHSNASIAEALHVSVKTVERHLSTIYVKLDVRNRAEATARYVHDLGPPTS